MSTQYRWPCSTRQRACLAELQLQALMPPCQSCVSLANNSLPQNYLNPIRTVLFYTYAYYLDMSHVPTHVNFSNFLKRPGKCRFDRWSVNQCPGATAALLCFHGCLERHEESFSFEGIWTDLVAIDSRLSRG